jgi:hypothetical protein
VRSIDLRKVLVGRRQEKNRRVWILDVGYMKSYVLNLKYPSKKLLRAILLFILPIFLTS